MRFPRNGRSTGRAIDAALICAIAMRAAGLLSSLSTLREGERAMMPPPASALFTMIYAGLEGEAKSVRDVYSKRFKAPPKGS